MSFRFGKPALVSAPPEPEKVKVRVYTVTATVRGGIEWSWKFEGDEGWEQAKELLANLTGEPDALGWIRNIGETWAYRPEEIRGARIMWVDVERDAPPKLVAVS